MIAGRTFSRLATPGISVFKRKMHIESIPMCKFSPKLSLAAAHRPKELKYI